MYTCSQMGAADPNTPQDSKPFRSRSVQQLCETDQTARDARVFTSSSESRPLHSDKKRYETCSLKLRGRISEATAENLSRITKDVFLAFAAELQLEKRTSTMLKAHPGMRTLLRTLQAVSRNATWTDHGKHGVRTHATSTMMVLGHHFFSRR